MNKENIYKVYGHLNVTNGKWYIGSTKQNLKKRWKNGLGYNYNSKMLPDLLKTDWNTDWIHTVFDTFSNREDALDYEAFLIAMLDTIENGYNTSEYGGFSCRHSEETKNKLSKARTGIAFTEEHKKHISESMTGHEVSEETKKKISESLSGEKAYWYGKHLSEETKNKISKARTGHEESEEHRQKISQSLGVNGILQYSKDGEFIAEYPSTKEAERQTGCYHSSISKCCKGKLKSTGSFIWRYKE